VAIQKTNNKLNEVSTEIDVKELLGGLSNDRDVREAFFQLALDKMSERLDKGLDVNGSKMDKYSKEYKESLAYQAFEKTGVVNMQLTGSMLAAVDIIEQNKNKMKVGVTGSEAPKAYNHQVGDTLPQREWFGWKDSELKSIAKEFKPLKDEGPSISDVQIVDLLDRLLAIEKS
jgi:hypothetical protein